MLSIIVDLAQFSIPREFSALFFVIFDLDRLQIGFAKSIYKYKSIWKD